MPERRKALISLAISIVFACGAYWTYVTVVGNVSQQAIATMMESNIQKAKAQAAKLEAERQAQQALAAQTHRQQLEQQAASDRVHAAAELAALREEAERQSAWAAYYQPPPECLKPANWEMQVECGNRHMRAKRQLDAEWRASQVAGQ